MGESIVTIKNTENNYNYNYKYEDATNASRILPVLVTPPQQMVSNSWGWFSWYEKGEIHKRMIRTSVKFLRWIGYEEIFSTQVWRASIAELLSTSILVFMFDNIIMSSKIHNDTPNILLACFVAIIVAFLRLATHPISGGHMNPTITISATFMGLISFSRAIIYLIAQCIGSTLGAWGLQAMVMGSITNSTYLLGGCTLEVVAPSPNGHTTIGIETAQGLWAEIIYTFIFLFSVWMAFDQKRAKELGQVLMCSITGIVVGLTMYLSMTVTMKKGYTGAIINPARCIGPAIVRGGHLWNDHWVFWAGPIIACVLFYFYSLLLPIENFKARTT
ncbi:probable aquaporin PIP1-2 [Amaranthus tricolor]|uniref:probable aquaporin PIP1-2 n=1 Tax=Amaranthus tricolor TaxID=29722 RepID=UPI002585D77E|nr:probable aquaporin PIP1-2 [Amaranthus tricolor]